MTVYERYCIELLQLKEELKKEILKDIETVRLSQNEKNEVLVKKEKANNTK